MCFLSRTFYLCLFLVVEHWKNGLVPVSGGADNPLIWQLFHLEVLTVQAMPIITLFVITTMSLPCSCSTEGDLLFQKHFSPSFCDTVSKQNCPENEGSWSLSFAFASFDEQSLRKHYAPFEHEPFDVHDRQFSLFFRRTPPHSYAHCVNYDCHKQTSGYLST